MPRSIMYRFCAWGTFTGRSTKAFRTLNTTAFAPIPSASVTTAVIVNPGDLTELPESKSKVGHDALHGLPLPYFTAALYDYSYIAEFAARGLLRLFPRHTAVRQVGDLLVKVLADRRGKLIITTAARQ